MEPKETPKPKLTSESEPEVYDDDDYEWECQTCAGEGFVWGSDLGDPLWYDEDAIYDCHNCRGSGLRKDQTFW